MYSEPDSTGDVTTNGSVVVVSFAFTPSGRMGQGSDQTPAFIGGNGSAGTIRLEQCFLFDDDGSVTMMVGIRDDEGNPSNVLSIGIPRPQGAN